MSFYILQNSTTADPSDVNDNFYHIGQGSLMPMSGISLSSTDITCDLGSSLYKWNELHADTGNFATVTYSSSFVHSGNIELIQEFIATATTASFEITGLNGDSDGVYTMYISGNSGYRPIFQINGISSSTYYNTYTYVDNTYTTIAYSTSSYFIGGANVSSSLPSFFVFTVNFKSNVRKYCCYYGKSHNRIWLGNGLIDGIPTMTSIKFYNLDINSVIRLYGSN